MLYFGLHWSEQLRVAPTIALTDEQESELTRLARSKRTSVPLAQRARIVLLAAQGLQNKDIADQRRMFARAGARSNRCERPRSVSTGRVALRGAI
jgi:hypothetical protein